MDQMLELGRAIGRMEAELQDHGRRLSKLEKRRPPVDWKPMLPYIYGVTILGLAVAGKIQWSDALKAMQVMSGSQ